MRQLHTRFLAACAFAAAIALLPAAGHAQATATICKDGTTSAAKGRGACGQHGGVDAAATKSARDAARASRRAAAAAKKMVTCTDGTTATRGRGACSGHGGVQKSATAQTNPTEHHVENRTENRNEDRNAQGENRTTTPERERTRAGTGAGAGSGTGVGRERDDNDASGAIAQCNDGLYSHAKSRRGACSRHGGVKQWIGG